MALLAAVAVATACSPVPLESSDPSASGGASPGLAATLAPTVPPIPGHELYGYLPYWEMDDAGIAEHVADTPLTTLALFSVTHGRSGAMRETARGYDLVAGGVGRGLIDEAHRRGTRV
jgi:hypothetical protein